MNANGSMLFVQQSHFSTKPVISIALGSHAATPLQSRVAAQKNPMLSFSNQIEIDSHGYLFKHRPRDGRS